MSNAAKQQVTKAFGDRSAMKQAAAEASAANQANAAGKRAQVLGNTK